MNEAELYGLAAYGEMIADRARVEAYRQALREVVVPGCSVLDVGAGTGLLALMAAGLGAERVYAVEPSRVVDLARRIARENGLADRVSFFQDDVLDVTLENRVDVAVSDLRGVLPLFRRHIPAIVDVRERLLKPSGRLVPLRDHLFVSVVEDAELYERIVGPWRREPGNVDMRSGRELACNTWRQARFTTGQLLTEPAPWATLEYTTIVDADVSGRVSARAKRDGVGHGLAVWFDAELTDAVAYRNAPGEGYRIYGQAFFPWPRPVRLRAGAGLEVFLAADLVRDGYVWRWETSFADTHAREEGLDGAPAESIRAITDQGFRQSSFYGSLLSAAEMRHLQADFVPSPSPHGEIDRQILALIDGRRTLQQIADAAVEKLPDAFDDARDALDRVARLAWRYRN